MTFALPTLHCLLPYLVLSLSSLFALEPIPWGHQTSLSPGVSSVSPQHISSVALVEISWLPPHSNTAEMTGDNAADYGTCDRSWHDPSRESDAEKRTPRPLRWSGEEKWKARDESEGERGEGKDEGSLFTSLLLISQVCCDRKREKVKKESSEQIRRDSRDEEKRWKREEGLGQMADQSFVISPQQLIVRDGS
jgi:hypothetical protein